MKYNPNTERFIPGGRLFSGLVEETGLVKYLTQLPSGDPRANDLFTNLVNTLVDKKILPFKAPGVRGDICDVVNPPYYEDAAFSGVMHQAVYLRFDSFMGVLTRDNMPNAADFRRDYRDKTGNAGEILTRLKGMEDFYKDNAEFKSGVELGRRLVYDYDDKARTPKNSWIVGKDNTFTNTDSLQTLRRRNILVSDLARYTNGWDILGAKYYK